MIIPIPLPFSNSYVLQSEQAAILVDTGSKGDTQRIVQALEALQIAPASLNLIVHTHAHPDHCGATALLAKQFQIPTLLHQYDYESLSGGRPQQLQAHNWEGHLLQLLVRHMQLPFFEPDYQMDSDEYSLSDFGVAATAYLTPGHTMGSISIVDHSTNQAIVGDLLMGGYCFNRFRKAQPRLPFFIENRSVLHWSIRRLLELPLDYWHPGHGIALSTQLIRNTFLKREG